MSFPLYLNEKEKIYIKLTLIDPISAMILMVVSHGEHLWRWSTSVTIDWTLEMQIPLKKIIQNFA